MSFTRTLGRRGAAVGPGKRTHGRTRRRAPRRLRLTPRMRLLIAAGIVLGGLLFGVWTWVRDSSLVGIDQVTITGASGADAGAISAALRSAARNMTTLDVQMNQLHTAVTPFPEVERLQVRAEFPHRLVIDVVEQRPVALVDAGGHEVPVASDGTILRAVAVSSALPVVPVSVPPVGRHLSEGRAAEAVAVLAAAPYQLLARISQVTTVAGHGLVAQLRNGPSLYFGDTSHLAAKWVAVTEVLADQSSAGAAYIDVTDPGRPAAGAGSGSGSTTAGAGPGSGSASAGTALGSGGASAGTTSASGSASAAASASPTTTGGGAGVGAAVTPGSTSSTGG